MCFRSPYSSKGRWLTFESIVFVHGLLGDRYRTWTAKNGTWRPSLFSRLKSTAGRRKSDPASHERDSVPKSVFWPRDLLSQSIPNARIITYGYNADVSTFLSKSADNSIFNIAQDLVTRLEILRSDPDTVCHCRYPTNEGSIDAYRKTFL